MRKYRDIAPNGHDVLMTTPEIDKLLEEAFDAAQHACERYRELQSNQDLLTLRLRNLEAMHAPKQSVKSKVSRLLWKWLTGLAECAAKTGRIQVAAPETKE